jgi:hypothetical protein
MNIKQFVIALLIIHCCLWLASMYMTNTGAIGGVSLPVTPQNMQTQPNLPWGNSTSQTVSGNVTYPSFGFLSNPANYILNSTTGAIAGTLAAVGILGMIFNFFSGAGTNWAIVFIIFILVAASIVIPVAQWLTLGTLLLLSELMPSSLWFVSDVIGVIMFITVVFGIIEIFVNRSMTQ